MAYDYDKLYGETPNALGGPDVNIVGFFDDFAPVDARVLDIGCGQGRDALFIAQKGHRVVGVDISPNGIRNLTTTAARKGLSIKGVVADASAYSPDGVFDVILADRMLHMLEPAARHKVLHSMLDHVAPGGWLLLVDEAANIRLFETVISADAAAWSIQLQRRGYLFAQRSPVAPDQTNRRTLRQ